MRELNNKEIDKLSNSLLEYIGIIDSSKKILVYNCVEHGRIEQRFDVHLKNKYKCPKCPREKKLYTKDYLLKLVNKREIKYDIIFEKDVYGVLDKIKLICDKHGVFKQSIHNHFNIGNCCPKCKKYKIISELTIIKLKNKNISVIKYNGSREKSELKCGLHGKFSSNINNTLKYGCPICNQLKRNSINKKLFIEQSKLKWGHIINFDYDNMIYNGQRKKIRIYSDVTGWVNQTGGNHLNGFMPKNSTGELIIKNILNGRNIIYTEQKTFDDCKNVYKLRFDFYLPESNICIEFNGIQHYKPIDFFGGLDRLEKQRINDNIKVNFCKQNNIKLIVISYKDSIIEKINEIIC